jgi:S-formylglutathione hydrolase FrmB
MDQVFGADPIAGGPNDLFHLVDEVDPAAAPPLWLSCGTEDVLIDSHRRLVVKIRSKGLTLEERSGPGEHEWGLWDRQIQDVLAWLPLRAGRAGR